MTEDNLAPYRSLQFMQSRIPAPDALATFVPEGQDDDPGVRAAIEVKGCSRWFPIDGGHQVLIPYEGQDFDAKRFRIEKGGWDHEHCKACGGNIEPRTLCWVTVKDPYVILCSECYDGIRKNEEPNPASGTADGG